MGGMQTMFWSPEVWLPPGWTWENLSEATDFKYPQYQDIWIYPFFISAIMLLLRYLILNPLFFIPLGTRMGICDSRPRPPSPSHKFEMVYSKHHTRPPPDILKSAATTEGVSERHVERWLRQRAASSRTGDLTKFCDLAWDVAYYTFYCILGFMVLRQEKFLWDIDYCFVNFPRHSVSPGVYWYYMVALGYYWCMTLTHFFGHRRKDAAQLLAHHALTILLMNLSWACNFVRIGSLVLLVHECADIPMTLAKICKLCKRRDLMDLLFIVFLVLWLCTRTGLYPFWILSTTLFRAHTIAKMFYPVYYIFNCMLLLLLLLHIYWTYLILRIVVLKVTSSRLQDVRSSSDASSEADYEDTKKEN